MRVKKMFLKKADKIESAKSLVSGALSMFHKAVDEINQANELLDEVKQSGQLRKRLLQEQIQNIEKEIEQADADMSSNNNLKKKFADFVSVDKK